MMTTAREEIARLVTRDEDGLTVQQLLMRSVGEGESFPCRATLNGKLVGAYEVCREDDRVVFWPVDPDCKYATAFAIVLPPPTVKIETAAPAGGRPVAKSSLCSECLDRAIMEYNANPDHDPDGMNAARGIGVGMLMMVVVMAVIVIGCLAAGN